MFTRKTYTRFELLVKGAIALIAFFALVALVGGSSTSPEQARETLMKQGFDNVQTHDVSYFACGQDDLRGRKFTATNPRGTEVGGVVCCGVFKGCTVRF